MFHLLDKTGVQLTYRNLQFIILRKMQPIGSTREDFYRTEIISRTFCQSHEKGNY